MKIHKLRKKASQPAVERYRYLFVMLMSAGFIASASAQESSAWQASGFMRVQTAVSLTKDNPANQALGLESDQTLNLAKAFGVLDLSYRPTLGAGAVIDSFKFFMRSRLNIDGTQDLGSGLSKYDPFPVPYKNDGSLLRAKGDKAVAEIWEVFADISAGSAWWRLGRQNIVWGEADAIRLLDVVNALDQTQHSFIEAGGEQFDHIRIPVWALRGIYKFAFAPNFSLDGFVIPGDFVPTWSAARGAPFNFNPLPSNVPAAGPVGLFPPGLRLEDDIKSRRHDAEGGVRLIGKVADTTFTLNYLNKIDQDGVTVGGFDPIQNQVVLRTEHDRRHILGASFNSFSATLGAVFRGELTHVRKQRYSNLLAATDPTAPATVEADTTKFVLGFDRPTFVFNTDSAMNISLQWFQTLRDLGGKKISILGAPGDKSETNFSLFISQPVMNNQLFFELLAIYDTDKAYWLQPQLRYNPGDRWRVAVYANTFGGSEKRPGRFGSLRDARELNVSVTYQF